MLLILAQHPIASWEHVLPLEPTHMTLTPVKLVLTHLAAQYRSWDLNPSWTDCCLPFML